MSQKYKIPLYVSYTEHRESVDYFYEKYTDDIDTDPSEDFKEYQMDFYVEGVSIKKPENSAYYEGRVLTSSNKCPDDAYVLIVRYNSGGTFSHIRGMGHIEGVYETSQEAESIVKDIKNNQYKGYRPWDGYFESLTGAYVECFKILY